ncbi:sigma-70 family RNA polymerase sigma factor [Prevotella sp. P2-180]|uniref:sigma-70 family RNA polymerase sigma factor n=1 Tax=Prevotella sp. P2-180 TaxID=2024224 RepID=UPI000B973960|nr:sigma-70 family RNA polymerase sigma factor [Prevotella sp. P2-180]MCI6336369.1 sigma-70 family RNA polymerase sigma factor [Prevotella sp.]MCI7088576.1 sigma-70 family RNA polymerase sigma factor [Prevotella sp.]MDD5784884.1 sigma-70 family RNA polymerase sigma factor [Prevotella sp.]MDD6863983.1 sigma-70 family RNA polymerase sigma factor [Prevotella sp.]MDD7224790.1 sigma-70 family RNA polymerase sigma factor [Prevotella sp.]
MKEDRNKIVTDNMGLVVSTARKYQGQGLELDDLVSEGTIGMIKAAERYNPEKGGFAAFALPEIKKSIEAAIEQQSGLYRIPRKEKSVVEKKRRVPLSVDAPLGGRENINLLSLLVNTNAKDSDIDATSSSYMKLIIDVLDLLDKREREVITCFYGIRRDRLSLAEIAAQMCIKRERARQIRDKATRKIRKAIRKS